MVRFTSALALAVLAHETQAVVFTTNIVVTQTVTVHGSAPAGNGDASGNGNGYAPVAGEGGVLLEHHSPGGGSSLTSSTEATTSPTTPAAAVVPTTAPAAVPTTTSPTVTPVASPSTTSQSSSVVSSSADEEGDEGLGFLQTSKVTTSLGSVMSHSLPPSTTAAPTYATNSDYSYQSYDGQGLTFSITNMYGSALALSFGQNADAPGTPVATPSGFDSPNVITAIDSAAATVVVMPETWAGRIAIGEGPDPRGSKIEGAYGKTSMPDGSPFYVRDVDISYVDGYTVPIVCSATGDYIGCNIELFNGTGAADGSGSTPCSDIESSQGQICINPANTAEGNAKPPAFFNRCANSAYVYPKNDVANVGDVGSNTVNCCIGTAEDGCPTPKIQNPDFQGFSKRNLEASKAQELSKRSKQRSHIHRHAHAHKGSF